MRYRQVIYTIGVIAILAICAKVPLGENIDPDNDGSQYAWGENVGWINFEPDLSESSVGATVSCEKLTGFIWAENIGWINLDPDDSDPETGIKNDDTGTLSGFAWCENVGWINFNPKVGGEATGCGVTIDNKGNFDGWAWGENIGWIHFRSAGPVAYKVKACKVNFEDLVRLADQWLESGTGLDADLSGDNEVDFADYSRFAGLWLDYCPDEWRLK